MSLGNGVGITSYGDRCRIMIVQSRITITLSAHQRRGSPHGLKVTSSTASCDSHALVELLLAVLVLIHKLSPGGGGMGHPSY